MLVTTIKTFELPSWSSLIVLDNKLYYLKMLWNNTDAAWYLSLYTDDMRYIIVEAVKVVLNTDLLQYSYSEFKPGGYIIASSDSVNEITFDNLGNEVKLQYLVES